jgi:hypothetical protein
MKTNTYDQVIGFFLICKVTTFRNRMALCKTIPIFDVCPTALHLLNSYLTF